MVRAACRREISSLSEANFRTPSYAKVTGSPLASIGPCALRAERRRFVVIGYDDVRTAALWEPPLTSVATRPEMLGRAAAELLLEEIAEPSAAPSQRVFAPELVVRQSCGCGGGPKSNA
ncbi:substrate-binding domain-containing protein [Arthrobacter liuii]|uniref:substrate-binding domain-containing protein n=1 Tax=Arthrobacter liuii TaxID=1476996 RepID=UPI0035710370